MKEFDDNCEELSILRWFRDNFVNKEDINHYYEIAPIIVEEINKLDENDKLYEYIYNTIIQSCVNAIKKGNYDFAYQKYKTSILVLEEQFVKPVLHQKFIRILSFK